jgi:hypothetical protein
MADFKNRTRSSKKYRGFDRNPPIMPEEKRDCGPGKKWVPAYRRNDGTYVRGHCAEIGDKKELEPVEIRTKSTLRLGLPPYYERSKEVVERHRDDVATESGEMEIY